MFFFIYLNDLPNLKHNMNLVQNIILIVFYIRELYLFLLNILYNIYGVMMNHHLHIRLFFMDHIVNILALNIFYIDAIVLQEVGILYHICRNGNEDPFRLGD